MDLLGENAGGVRANRRHRAEPSAADRVKVAAGAAVAAGALIGSASQLVPALANAAPLSGNNAEKRAAEDTDLSLATQTLEQATEAEAPAPAAPAVPDAQAAPVAGQAAPFGLTNLPPEIAAPLAQAEQTLKSLQQQFAPAPAVAPVAGQISSGFGSRWGAMHYGVDFADALGAPIKSVMGGTVVEAGPASGFGLWVRILQDDGTTAVYGHVNDMLVHEGQRVNAGDVIATVGNRGQSTGPHLHLEIWDAAGNKMDPLPWLASKGVVMQQQWGPGL
ncbi:M23 family metallopeptidase [Nocardia otitidiscaviarum]|uniref:M23 family metallopeptidase n=1 Tax=Nocardia otitidiscaviarum TaxID=1823 RepID=UPI000693431C|nr:M23 family metallopeptidase [Nocardia otitidiscaviarum]MBF6133916.1 M23 family metallopeptidase [Nocardia otitidiscaviarum]MBF6484423.1 M23 family metallopeptidase [Nocardia otitidiscaviarum]